MATRDIIQVIILAFGGIGLFLFGIYLLGESLKNLSSSKLRTIVEKTTNKAWKGVLIGALLTALMQSSSGVTGIVIGLLSAGFMTLPQAIAVVMGANLGTTITAVIVGIPVQEYALIIVGIGAILTLFFKKKRSVYMLGQVLFGLGLLFYGLQVMGDGLKILSNQPFFVETLANLNNPILAILTGTIFTAIIQSSSASIGIVQQLYDTFINGNHIFTLQAAVGVCLGANIGTTITGVLSSFVGSRNAKRCALFHVLFNVFGVLFFVIIFPYYIQFLQLCENTIPYLSNNPKNTIALAHIIFNATTILLTIWFIKYITVVIEKLIKMTSDEIMLRGVENLDEKLLDAPSLALSTSRTLIINMTQIVFSMYENVKTYVNNIDPKASELINTYEGIIDNYDNKLHDFLMKLSSHNLDTKEMKEQSKYFDTIRDLERIADHVVNLMEFMQERYNENNSFNEESLKMINHMLELITTMLTDAFKAFELNDIKLARHVRAIEPLIDELEKKYRKAKINMLTSGQVENIDEDIHFVDILANLERIGDHANNIADNILYDSFHNVVETEE